MSKIMGISRLRMGTDGTGISTLVGFPKCPLKCKYCLNSFCHEENVVEYDYSPEELIEVLKIDEAYFLMTGGGVTFGGGEPLLQAEFIRRVCELLEGRWNIRVETALNVPWEAVEMLAPYIDRWMIDIKDLDEEIYRSYTGCSNKQVLDNLERLTRQIGKEKIHIRIPHIPGYNDREHVLENERIITEKYGVETEVFTYLTNAHNV